ncbi:MAG TPA: TIGR03088 family PEP-CTERM/XrtA system glycosyltransferase [Rhodocyclaceae bacterium]|nr:TIGR03088 family PEP-CTERM/XrtA system glycosyltransferase [Rhodocyclaceae bacterium]
MKRSSSQAPLVAHVVFRLDVGGLENGVVNLINHMPRDAYRHMVISLTEITDFRRRIVRDDVEFIALNKRPGHAFRLYPRIRRLLRERSPAIVHTRNLAALEVTAPAWAAGVPVRIHGEHGRAVSGHHPSDRKYRLVRRLYSPFVTSYVALSRDLEDYLCAQVGIDPERVAQIYNGVDTRLFRPGQGRQPIPGCPFTDPGHWLVGTVGRLQDIKDQTNLARAFVLALQREPRLASRMRLVVVGEGPLRREVLDVLHAAGMRDLAWLPGNRDDIPDILRGLDCFVLPSLSEGISNAILEAMASALPVIATAVGGNGELIADGKTGILVAAGDPDALARQLVAHAANPDAARIRGVAARGEVERRFSLDAMVNAHVKLYDGLLFDAGVVARELPELAAGKAAALPLTEASASHVRNHGHF